MTPFYKFLLEKDLRALVYNGDADMACNFLGGEKFVASLNQPVSNWERICLTWGKSFLG